MWVLIDQGGRDERQREGVERLESGLGGSGAPRMAGGQSLKRSEGEETAAAGMGVPTLGWNGHGTCTEGREFKAYSEGEAEEHFWSSCAVWKALSGG